MIALILVFFRLGFSEEHPQDRRGQRGNGGERYITEMRPEPLKQIAGDGRANRSGNAAQRAKAPRGRD